MTTFASSDVAIEVDPAKRIRRARRPGVLILGALVTLTMGATATVMATGGSISWSTVSNYLFNDRILAGVRLTIVLTLLVMTLSIVGGAVIASMTLSGNRTLIAIASVFTWFFRGTPLLVQLILWFNIALFVPYISVGPVAISTNDLVTPYLAAILALTLHESAYMGEIIRAGLLGIRPGQRQAAAALGLTPWQSLRRVVMPQALRIIIPPTGNQTIGMLKATSLVSVIAVQDLLTHAQQIYAANFRIIELLFVASIWYLFLTSLASMLQRWIERRLADPALTPEHQELT